MKQFLFALGVAAMLAACGNNNDGRMSVAEYNDQAVGIFNRVSGKVATSREALSANKYTTEKTRGLVADLRATLGTAITQTEALPYPEVADALQQSLLKFYTYERDSVVPLMDESLNFEHGSYEWYGVWNELEGRGRRVNELLKNMSGHQQALSSQVK